MRKLSGPNDPNGAELRSSAQGSHQASVKLTETGQWKKVNGLDATEVISSLEAGIELAGGIALRVEFESDAWVSPTIAGSNEMHAFFRARESEFPWGAIVTNASPGIQDGLAKLQGWMADSVGAPVSQVTRIKLPANAQLDIPPHMDPAASARVQWGFKQMQDLAKQNDFRGVLLETTADSSEFSDARVPDFVFAIPNGYVLRD